MRKNHRLHFHRERYSVHPVDERKNSVQIFKKDLLYTMQPIVRSGLGQ
jgi:hypothetical protein